jgi:hypothetical protein
MTPDTPALMPNFTSRRAPAHISAAIIGLLRLGVDVNNVDFLVVGEYESYRGEVRSQRPEPGTELHPDTHISLEVACLSAVDQIPYQFFYGLGSAASAGKAWEEAARRLMAPFDAALVRSQGVARYHSLKLTYGHYDRAQLERFVDIFDVKPPDIRLSQRELLVLASLLPAYNEWAGNARGIAEALELMFRLRFEIIQNVACRFPIPSRLHYRLGQKKAGLGRDTLVGDSFTEADSAFLVVVRDLDPEQVTDLLPGKPLRQKLDWFLKLAVPGNLVCTIRLMPRRTGVRLGSAEMPAHLGLATCL